MTWLLTIESLDADDNPKTLRFSTARYIDPEKHHWLPRIKQPGLYQAGMYAGQIISTSRAGFGETTLINNDGGLNHLVDYAVDGREASLRLVTATGIKDVWSGTVLRLAFEGGDVSVRLRDPLESLQQNHPRNYYSGDNVLPDGLEGTADDIKGQPKPRLYGECVNAVPVTVNSSKLIYEISDQSCAVTAVYDNGVQLTPGANYSSLAELQSTAPVAGEWRSHQGYIRLGALPAGTVTVDAVASSPALGDVSAAVLADAGMSLDAADQTALNSYTPIRLWLMSEVTTASLLDQLAISIGGYWRLDVSGVVRMELLPEPGTPVLTLRDYQITSISRTAAGAGDNGLPVYKVSCEADPIETEQGGLAGSVSAAHRSRMASQYRVESVESAAVKARHPLSNELTITTRLGDLSQAATVAARVLDLISVRRDRVSLDAQVDDAAEIVVGQTIRVLTPRLGYQQGRNMVVIGHRLDAEQNKITLDLWG